MTAIRNADSYLPNVEPKEEFSFTLDDLDNVLELVKITLEEDMFHRARGEWVEIGSDDEMPTIFDRTMLNIEPSEIGLATEFWSKNEGNIRAVRKSEVTRFAAFTR